MMLTREQIDGWAKAYGMTHHYEIIAQLKCAIDLQASLSESESAADEDIKDAIEALKDPYAMVSFHGDAERVIISQDTADLALKALEFYKKHAKAVANARCVGGESKKEDEACVVAPRSGDKGGD